MNLFVSTIKGNSYILPVTTFSVILGALLALSLKTQQSIRQASLPSNRFPGLASAFLDQQDRIKLLNEEVSKLRAQITDYENEMASAGSNTELLNKSLQEIKLQAGLTEVVGPGIVLTLQDSKKKPSDSLPLENYIIHDTDLQRVINELRAAGAEAIAVNGQRVVGSTAIRCVGPTIQVNGVAIAGPFQIACIGPPDGLRSSLEMPGGVLADITAFDPAMARIDVPKEVRAPAYSGSLTLRYVKPVQPAPSPKPEGQR